MGKLDNAWQLFHSSLHAGPTPSAVTYAIMIHGLCKEGQMGKATDLLIDMEVKRFGAQYICI